MIPMRSRGFVSLRVLAACMIVIGVTGFALWRERDAVQAQNPDTQNFTVGATTTSGATATTSADEGEPYAAFDDYSLLNNIEHPTVTGTCGNVSGPIEIALFPPGDGPPPTDVVPVSSVYTARSDTGELSATCTGPKGGFSTHDGAINLGRGDYIVDLYALGKNDSVRMLTTAVITVSTSTRESSGFDALRSGGAVRASDGQSGYARDDDGVYTLSAQGRGDAIPGADAATFEVSAKWPIYARDKNNAYIYGHVIDGADPATFKALCGVPVTLESWCGYSKDAAAVYAYGQIVPDADPASFVSMISNNESDTLDGHKMWVNVAIDKNAIYDGYDFSHGDPANVTQGQRITTLADGTPIHFSDTSRVTASDSSGPLWAGYYVGVKIGSKEYHGGMNLTDGATVYTIYSACDLDASGHEQNCRERVSKVAKVGDRPAGL